MGGIISSTAITLSFSSLSRRKPAEGVVDAGALAGGVFSACTVLLLRTVALGGILNPALLKPLVPYVVPPFLVGAGLALTLVLRRGGESEPGAHSVAKDVSPLGLWSAVRMALLFQAVLILIPLANAAWGNLGVLTSAALVGMTDMDALTLAMAKLGSRPESLVLAAQGIGIGLLASTLLRLGIAVAVGWGPYRRKVGVGLAAYAAAIGVGIWIAARAI
jgi:uncharacterized membrane protein (DUF4010 family)